MHLSEIQSLHLECQELERAALHNKRWRWHLEIYYRSAILLRHLAGYEGCSDDPATNQGTYFFVIAQSQAVLELRTLAFSFCHLQACKVIITRKTTR